MNTNKIITGYKLRAQNKLNNAVDTILYSIARAYKVAESEGEAGYLAGKYILAAFTPITCHKKLQCNVNGDAFAALNSHLRNLAAGFIPEYWKRELDGVDDIQPIIQMAQRLTDMTSRHYLYIFVRQDMIPEQQAVQAAHATFKAGAKIRAAELKTNRREPFNPDKTHFVLLGVPNLNTLNELYDKYNDDRTNNFGTYPFYEEDIGGEMTAFACGIVTQEHRHKFAGFNLLKFGI